MRVTVCMCRKETPRARSKNKHLIQELAAKSAGQTVRLKGIGKYKKNCATVSELTQFCSQTDIMAESARFHGR